MIFIHSNRKIIQTDEDELESRSSRERESDPDRYVEIARQIASVKSVSGGLRVLSDLLEYLKAQEKFGDVGEETDSLFSRFLAARDGRVCLCLFADSQRKPDLGSNWLMLNLNDIELIARETGVVSLGFEDEFFDSVICTGLERISRPARLISEVTRVLKRTGQIWIQTLLCAPYLDVDMESGTEYWRFTPNGLRILLEGYDEIFCSAYLPDGNALRVGSIFYGLKSPDESGTLVGF